jgi:hypothetical protein
MLREPFVTRWGRAMSNSARGVRRMGEQPGVGARTTEVSGMPKTVHIRMTGAGFEVTSGDQTRQFSHLGDAVAFAQERLGRAQHLRELSSHIE